MPQRPTMPFRPPTQPTANPSGMQPSMRFNLGTLPYTFMQMGPDGITLNQVSASVVADVQTSTSTSPQEQQQQQQQQASGNRPMPGMRCCSRKNFSKEIYFLVLANMPPGATHVISSGPIQINADQLDNNLATQIAQRVASSVQRSYHLF